MVDGVKKISSFEDLTSWQEAIDLAVITYSLTKKFPKDEQFALTSQIRRASSSISANIAEGFGRFNQKEKAQFYKIAYGSLSEVKSFMYLSEKIGYINSDELRNILPAITLLQKRINSLISAVKDRS